MPLFRKAPPPAPATGGEAITGYYDLQRIGRGGFSVVYRARQDQLDRVVALKVLSVEFIDTQVGKRFLREVRLTSRLTGHPNVVTVLDSGMSTAGRPYIAMEYFERGSLRDRLAAEGPLPLADVLRIGVKVAGALAAAHQEGVLHRDVKPQNILVSRYGEPALADFGTARLTDALDVSSRTEALTPYHAAPEILQGSTPSTACDVYSLGSTLYQLLAGRPPYQSDDGGIAALLLRVLRDDPPHIARGDVPSTVADAIRRAMAKEPADRYPDAWSFANALQRLQLDLGFPADRVGQRAVPARRPAQPGREPVRRTVPAAGRHDPCGRRRGGAPGRSGAGRACRVGGGAGATTAAQADPDRDPPDAPDGWGGPGGTVAAGPPLAAPTAEETGGTREYTAGDRTTQPSGIRLAGAGQPVEVAESAPAGPGRRPRWPITVAVGVLVVVAVLAPIVFSGHHHGQPSGTPSGVTAPGTGDATGAGTGAGTGGAAPNPATTVNVDALKPIGLAMTVDAGTSVTPHWTLAPGTATDNLYLTVTPRDPGRGPMILNPGLTSYTVPGLNPVTGYCFQVGPILTIAASGQNGSTALATVCIRGAVASPTP